MSENKGLLITVGFLTPVSADTEKVQKVDRKFEDQLFMRFIL